MKKETNRKEDKEKTGTADHIREDVERMKESLFNKCEDRAIKLAADISNLETKTRSIVEIKNKIQNVEEVQCQ
jgi:hypothetical protein